MSKTKTKKMAAPTANTLPNFSHIEGKLDELDKRLVSINTLLNKPKKQTWLTKLVASVNHNNAE